MQKYFESVVSSNGSAVQGASISVYSYGLSTLATIYSDSTGTTTKTNPITTDNNGYFEFYAADGRYSITVSGAGIGTRTITDIQLDDPNSASPLVASTLIVNGTDYTNLYPNMITQVSTAQGYSTSAATSATQAAAARDAAIAAWAASMNPAETLPAISKSLHYGAIVKAIIYDTSKDSDGGAWRKRCTDKSWYTETLGFTGTWGGQAASNALGWAACGSVTGGAYQSTADGKFYTPTSASTQTEIFRGNVREFPEQVAIVAESARVVIYDLTQVGCPMWMVFRGDVNGYLFKWASAAASITSVSCLNGKMVVGGANPLILDFVGDNYFALWSSQYGINAGNISLRNTVLSAVSGGKNGYIIVNATVNDVALTILDTAPIDPATGLPVPCIAVATAGGVSVIKDDGTVVNSSYTNNCANVAFSGTTLWVVGFTGLYISFTSLIGIAASFTANILNVPFSAWPNGGSTAAGMYANGAAAAKGSNIGLVRLQNNPATPAKGMVSYITNAYNTGWMPGDIRGAYLADTTAETITDGTTGTELVTNGTFTSDVSGWTGGNSGTITFSAGTAIVQNGAATSGYAYQTVTTVIGKVYTVSVAYTKGASVAGFLNIGTAPGGATLGSSTAGATGILSTIFTATATSTYISIGNGSSVSGEASIFDNVTCKLTSELVQNGTFTTDLASWTPGTGWAFAASTATKTAGTASNLTQAITTVVGKAYSFVFDATRSAGTLTVQAVGATVATITAAGTTLCNFTATATSTTLSFNADATFAGTVDNISVKLADPDRSVKNTGLVLNGTLTKTAVASGAGLVAYSGFSASNYLEQPYSANLDFGTGDFCVMGWVNLSSVGQSFMFDRGTVGAGRVALYVNASSQLSFSVSATAANVSTSIAISTGLHFVAMARASGVLYVYVDGWQTYSVANTANVTNTSALAELGVAYDKSSPLTGSLALWRISATAPSADQISHIYRTELPLFQANAKCIIDGTSTAVTALGYDENTDTLHVGTSWGRSSFRDLLRVDSEATSVGAVTSISGNEGAILTGGATTGKFYQPAFTLRDELRRKDIARKALGRVVVPLSFTATAAQTTFVCTKGYDVRFVYANGLLKTLTTDYTVTDDGFQKSVVFGSGLVLNTPVTILLTRA